MKENELSFQGPRYLPGEKNAIEDVVRLGAQYGYGNMISHLQTAWSKSLRESWPLLSVQTSDMAAGIICVWCLVDRRTGERVKKQ